MVYNSNADMHHDMQTPTQRYHAESSTLFLASNCVCIRWQTVFKPLTKSVIIYLIFGGRGKRRLLPPQFLIFSSLL